MSRSAPSRSFRFEGGIPARQIVDEKRRFDTTVTSIDRGGVRLRAVPSDLENVRFVWLEFRLPGEAATPIRALGELTGREGDEQRVRFKHLFPDHRRSVERFISRQEARSQAA